MMEHPGSDAIPDQVRSCREPLKRKFRCQILSFLLTTTPCALHRQTAIFPITVSSSFAQAFTGLVVSWEW